MNCFKTFIRFATAAATASMASLLLVSCEDDFRDESLFIPEGTGTISLQMEFTPMAEGLTGSRANDTINAIGGNAGKGDALNGIVDMCVLFYDKDGELLGDYVYYYNKDASQKPGALTDSHFITGPNRFTEVPRTDADASNGKLAQDKSMSGKFDVIKIPYGQYYIVGVANLGNIVSKKYDKPTTTYDELFNNADRSEAIKTLDGLRGLRLEWDASCLANNAEMFGCFTDGQTSREAASFFSEADLPTVIVNRDGMQLKSWLRRAASKVTIAFDGTDLRDNIWIHLNSAAIKDIPSGCDLGRNSRVTKVDSLLHRPAEDHQAGQYLDYTRRLPATDGGKYNTGWYTIVKGRKFPDKNNGSLVSGDENLRDPHNPTELSLFFYENMQGIGKDKRQYPDIGDDGKPNGAVKDDDILKDDKPCGTYIEVKAFYRSRDGVVSNGDIIYRFMLGKNIINDYNAERNYHYKLTLHFNGKANDYDWHIDYNEEPGIKVPIPYYYVPYMYNQHMVYPVTIIGELEGDLEAEIIRSDWGPSKLEAPGEKVAGLEYYSDTTKVVGNGPWHGFLSLRMAPLEPGTDRGRKASVGKVSGIDKEYIYNQSNAEKGQFNGIPYNKAYWIGEGDPSLNEKVNHRGHRFYNVTKTPITGRSDNANDDFANDGTYEVSTTTVNGVKHTTFLVPLYSREINLIKTAGYRGNNPYMGYYRYAEIRFTATVDGKKQSTVAKVLQVPRIVNPKGIYRSWNCTDPFNVHLMRLDSEDDIDGMNYVPVTSFGGPWSAEIEYITDGGGWLSVGGKTAKGDKIEGYTDSEIQFDVKFLSKCPNKDAVRCAVIKVLYHNYTCTHRIMVRQGYAPVAMASGSSTKWHTCNLQYAIKNDDGSYTGHEYEYPRGEGSMFKCGNLLEAIASVNNKRDYRYKSYPDGQDAYYLAPYKLDQKEDRPKAKWEDIGYNISAAFKGVTLDVNGTQCRVPKYEDYENLRKECDFGAGVLYGDGATETQTDVVKARGYATYLDMSERQSYGMRGWFVYNLGKDGLNLFFPIGVSGNGHRKDGSRKTGMSYVYEPGDARGVLRYAARSGFMPDGGPTGYAEYRPLLYTMHTQFGAVYWVSGDGSEVGTQAGTTAWDINYTTFDFNTYNTDATALFGGSDAGFIRLVED